MSNTIVQTPFKTPIRTPIATIAKMATTGANGLSREIAAFTCHDRRADHAAHRHDRSGREIDLGHHQNHHQAHRGHEQRQDLQEDVAKHWSGSAISGTKNQSASDIESRQREDEIV